MPAQKVIAYLRVSTDKQGRTGLGIEAQRSAVEEYLANGAQLIEEVVEVESGRCSGRPQLTRALGLCRIHRALLVVAKLDRLARDAHFLLGLKEAGVEFICCDMPAANRLTVGIMAMVAEEEARLISARTRAALAAAKRRGVKLGRPNLTDRARARGTRVSINARRQRAHVRALDLLPLVQEIQSSMGGGPAVLARELNARGIVAARGGRWSTTQAARLLAKAPVPGAERTNPRKRPP
jgi:DNA invertase Pin-like site-specific DNA recombinase